MTQERVTAQPEQRLPTTATSEAEIETLVRTFYGRIREDEMLGPVFARVIGEEWEPHLLKMMDFWSSVMLTTGRYHGRPMPAHMRLKDVTPAHFDRWLALFGQTVDEVCTAEAAPAFKERAHRIAGSLQLGMFFNPATAEGRGRAAD